MDVPRDCSLLVDSEYQSDLKDMVNQSDDQKHNRNSSKWSEDFSPNGGMSTELTQAGQLMSDSNLPLVCPSQTQLLLLRFFHFLYQHVMFYMG